MSRGNSVSVNTQVAVVIGAGGIGQAIGRRQASGKTVLLADRNEEVLASAARALESGGHRVATCPVDVSSGESVHALAQAAAELGDVVQVVHTAGLSPVQASPEAILAVDLVGTALVPEEFGQIIAADGAGLVVSSMAGYMQPPLNPDAEHALAHTPASELCSLPVLAPEAVPNSGTAYALAKRANHLRVQAAAVTWGFRGARVNSISPGIILTRLAPDEMTGPGAERYQKMIHTSAAGRVGTHRRGGHHRRRLPAGTRHRLRHRRRPAHRRRRHRRAARRPPASPAPLTHGRDSDHEAARLRTLG
jgi:NAD(P)-dependent dehydrogenase (short-subunit alcohol dehydrogenase family)